jgi:hypothetical protein
MERERLLELLGQKLTVVKLNIALANELGFTDINAISAITGLPNARIELALDVKQKSRTPKPSELILDYLNHRLRLTSRGTNQLKTAADLYLWTIKRVDGDHSLAMHSIRDCIDAAVAHGSFGGQVTYPIGYLKNYLMIQYFLNIDADSTPKSELRLNEDITGCRMAFDFISRRWEATKDKLIPVAA